MIRAKIYLRSGDNVKLAEVLPKLFKYARDYEERREGGEYEVFWLSELKDKRGKETKHSPDSLYKVLRDFIDRNGIRERLGGDEKIAGVMAEVDKLYEG